MRAGGWTDGVYLWLGAQGSWEALTCSGSCLLRGSPLSLQSTGPGIAYPTELTSPRGSCFNKIPSYSLLYKAEKLELCLCPAPHPRPLRAVACLGLHSELPLSRTEAAAKEEEEEINEKSGWRVEQRDREGDRQAEKETGERETGKESQKEPERSQKRAQALAADSVPIPSAGVSAAAPQRSAPGCPGHEGLQGAVASPPPLLRPLPTSPKGAGTASARGGFSEQSSGK